MKRKKLWELGKSLKTIFALLILCLSLDVSNAWGFRFDLGRSTTLDLDTTVIYGIQMRTKDASGRNLGINEDDGNRSFDQWDLVSNRGTVRTEMDLRRNNIGVFVRARGYYDDVYHRENENDSPETYNNGPIFGGPNHDHDDFADAVEDFHGHDFEFLDAYIYGDFYIADRPLTIKLGQQVVSWGESLFTLGSIASANWYADATMLNQPGVELEDIYLPTEQISVQYSFFPNVSFAGYYQWEWEKHRSEVAGSFFSYMDYADTGGHHLLLAPGLPATADRINDDYARDHGQFGLRLTYFADWLNDTELGLYYVRYHEKFPMVRTVSGAGGLKRDWGDPMLNFFDSLGYYLEYQEDIDLYGASFSTQVGPTNISGEISYRDDYMVRVKDPDPTNILGFTYEEFDVVQALASVTHIFGPFSFIDNTTLMFEVGMNEVIDEENLYNDDSAWGSMTSLTFDFFSIMPFLDMDIPISFKHRPNGVSSLPGTFTEDQEQISVGVGFLYRQRYEVDLKYVDFIGNPDEDPRSDRDYMSLSFRYTF